MHYSKSGQVWATPPNTVATPRMCIDDMLISSSNYRRGKQKEVKVNFLFPSLCGQQQNLLCLRDSGLRARYEDVPLTALTTGQLTKLLQYRSEIK